MLSQDLILIGGTEPGAIMFMIFIIMFCWDSMIVGSICTRIKGEEKE
jgi:hypothetical protein